MLTVTDLSGKKYQLVIAAPSSAAPDVLRPPVFGASTSSSSSSSSPASQSTSEPLLPTSARALSHKVTATGRLHVADIKYLLADQHNIPQHLQSLQLRRAAPGQSDATMAPLGDDDEVVVSGNNEELVLTTNLRGGGGCSLCGFSIRCDEIECKFRICCFYNGCDAQCNHCQFLCVKCGCF